MISSNYVFLLLYPGGGALLPFLLCTLKKTKPESFGNAFAIGLRGRSWAGAPVRGVGPICTVTSSLVPCLQQEVELAPSGLGYCPPGRKHACVLRVIAWLVHVSSLEAWGNASMSVCVCVWRGVYRCILFVLCICLCTCFVNLWPACLRDHNDLMSIKEESCVVTTGWEVYESYKHSCILHVDKYGRAKGLKNENCVAWVWAIQEHLH